MAIRTWESDEYHSFWKQSYLAYLDRMERELLSKIMGSGNWLIDIGGGYGRLMDLYKGRFSNVVISDYSISMLEDANRRLIREGYRNISLISADAHKLPFIDSAFDSAMMIRLIHHIRDPSPVFREVHRILKPRASFIFEYQNKRNFNFLIKARLGLMNWNDLATLEPYEAGPLYWNFHPRAMERLLADGFTLDQKLGGGLFWNRKRLTSLIPKLEIVDSVFARFLGRHALTHQLIIKLHSNKDAPGPGHNVPRDSLINILKCLRCGQSVLVSQDSRLICTHCHQSYHLLNNIYDFRIDLK